MKTITIKEERKLETGFEATLSFDRTDEYPITITNPFNSKQERQLEWYFERWLRWPMLDQVRANNTITSIKTYGENLFEQVFINRDAYSNYRQERNNLAQVTIEIVSRTPEFQAIHWEALRDPDLPRPFAVDCIMLRKYVKPVSTQAQVAESPVINLLVVTARPDEEDDVGYRTISRPLIEAIQNSKLRVKVELLRPGTYEALERHLEEKGSGFYRIIHFDVHGGLLKYEQYEQIRQQTQLDPHLYDSPYGRPSFLAPYSGVKAFLFLETETKGKADPVEAQQLADLLTGKSIPICILNACQSGKQISLDEGQEAETQATDERETSLGSRLMTAGMQMVVAMAYSVTVSAATLTITKLYTELFEEKNINEALRLSRRELFNNKGRAAYYNEKINLEDWLLPVVYCHQQVNLNLREFTVAERIEYSLQRSKKYRFPTPTYGFVGRDLEILKIEKRLLGRGFRLRSTHDSVLETHDKVVETHNILLLQGMGGTGKTTLLNYLRQWWQTTNFARQVFYFGYDEKAWNLQQIAFNLGSWLYEDETERAIFQTMPVEVQVEEIIDIFRANDRILMLDNLESVTGQQLAIQNTLPQEERQKLKEFLERLVGGKTKVILGSRSQEDWLKARTFENNVYELKGLDWEARTLLAQRILERNAVGNRIEKIKEDEKFKRLMKVLAGYPLAMEVVLANLKQQSPGEVLEGLQAADVTMDSGSEDKTRSILKCVEYSHSNLSPDAQKLLLCLAPFSGFIFNASIYDYANVLQKLEPFKDYPFDKFDLAIEEAINWGLLSPNKDYSQLLTIQPIFPYFLKAKLNELDEETREALWEGFKNHYLGMGNYYLDRLMKSKGAEKQQLGIFLCRLEYENLYNALLLCLKKHETVYIFLCLDQYLNLIKDFATNLKLAEFVYQAQKAYPEEIRTAEIELEIAMTLERLASSYLQTKNYSQAKDSYKQALELTQQLKGIEERQKQLTLGTAYHHLGIVAEELGEWDEAKNNYQQALAIDIEYGDRYSQASTYFQLGNVASRLREWDEARNNYQQALAIDIEYSDRYSQAKIYHQLGIVASRLREWDEAKNNYQQALAIDIEYNNRHSQAGTYSELGNVARELREWDKARHNYQQALAIFIEYSDRSSQASTYQNLGMVAEELREWHEARKNYLQALAIRIEYGDRYSQASSYGQLGSLAQKLGQSHEARNNFQQALAIYIEYGDRYSQAITYHQLGNLALELREWDEAKNNYQQALAIKIEYGDGHSQAKTYYQLGMLAEKLKEYSEAKANYLQALENFAEFNDRYTIEAFSIPALARLYQTTQDSSLLAQVASILGITVEQLKQLFAQINQQ